MQSFRVARIGLCLLLLGCLPDARALTLNLRAVKLSADQRASLQRFLASSLPALNFDWSSLAAHAHSIGRGRRQLSASLSTVPALTAAGICRNEQYHFQVDGSNGRWQTSEELTSRRAWAPQGGDCAAPSSPVEVGKSVSDEEFQFIERARDALRSRAAQVIGGSDCARVRYCEVTLRRINRVREESPPRTITRLTFTPLTPGPACLYVMEVSFVGPLAELVPLGASCPLP